MNKSDLVAEVAAKTDLSHAKVIEAVDRIFSTIQAQLKLGEEVRIGNFGIFSRASRAASKGRNIRTGEPIQIAASNTVRFRPSQTLRNATH
jgi:DNA-binding protein HU-beta